MNSIKLIIADENQYYAKGLARYLQQEYGQAFEIKCFTQKSVLQEYLSKGEAADILLIDQKLFNEHEPSAQIKSVIVLVENNIENSCNTIIYKYQKADQIARLILETYDKQSGRSTNIVKISEKARLICVYSPAGASGKTTIACNLAYQYALQSKRVLFISFETYASLEIFKSGEGSRGIMYLLYLAKNKLPNLQLKLNTIKEIDENTNIHFIKRENNVLEYKDIGIEDMELLAGLLKKQSGYDAVIMDLDSTVNNVVLGAFKYCDSIINVHCAEGFGCEKLENFYKQIPKFNNLLKTELSNKLICISNKSECRQYKGKDEEQIFTVQLSIPYINSIPANPGAYFPEMTYFKQLYDILENNHTNIGENYE